MQYQNYHDDSEESRFYENEEARSNANSEKLKSFWFVIFKYWMLLAALWGIKNLISSSGDVQLDTKLEHNTFDNIRRFINGYPLKIWDIMNCLLVFEGLRRKNLKILLKVITMMEVYMPVHMIITFFTLTSEAGLARGRTLFQQRFPDFNVDKGFLSFFAVLITLVWCSYYYLVHLYGAKKARDVLRGPQKHSRSFWKEK